MQLRRSGRLGAHEMRGIDMNASTGRQISAGNRAQRRATAKAKGRRRGSAAAQISASGLVLAAGIGAFGVSPAQAGFGPGSFIVTSLGDAGYGTPESLGTLRWAINNVNSYPGTQTITFAPTLSGSIVLTEGQLNISDSVSIVGPGSGVVSVNAGGLSRVLYAQGSFDSEMFDPETGWTTIPGPEVDVTISGLTITGGDTGSVDGEGGSAGGAGILARDVGLALNDVVLSGNTTEGDGGGLSFNGNNDPANSLSLVNTQIADNTAVYERTYSYGTYTYSRFSGNGGGVDVEDTSSLASISISGSTFSRNNSSQGGGLFVESNSNWPNGPEVASVSITGSTFELNNAHYYGGGVYIEAVSNSLSITSSYLTGNKAEGGAGIYVQSLYDGATINVSDSRILDNQAQDDGGGVSVSWAEEGSTITISESIVSGNSADQDGGGVYIDELYGSVSFVDTVITENTATYGGGGGLFLNDLYEGSTVTFEGSTISGNTADSSGGGLYVDWLYGSMSFVDTVITENTAGDNGGGVYVNDVDRYGGELSFAGSTISGNTAVEGDGGGLNAGNVDGSVSITDAVITDNAAAGSGGGVFVDGWSGNVEIVDSTISENEAAIGGGVAADSGNLRLTDSTVAGNTAQSSGGGMAVGRGPSFELAGGGEPSAMFSGEGVTQIIGSTITGNSVEMGDGGGLAVVGGNFESYPTVEVTESTISGNSASGNGGGVAATYGGSVDLSHSTVADNTAAAKGGGMAVGFGGTTLDHVIVGDNTGATGFADLGTLDGPVALGDEGDGSVFDLVYSVVEAADVSLIGETDHSTVGQDAGLGVLQDNGGPTETHLIAGSSPAANAGDPALLTEMPDQRGMARQIGVIDIGAVEMDFGSIEFVATSATVSEETGTLVVEVRRTGTAEGAVSATVTPVAGTATAGDFSSTALTATWADGETGVKTVNLGVVLDAAHEGDETLSLALSTSGASVGANASLPVTITNSNTAPTLADIGDVAVAFGTATVDVAATVGDGEQSGLTVTVSSSNQSVVADADLSVSGSGAARVITARPVPGTTGSTTITVTVSDGVLSTVDTFQLSVGAQPTLPPPPVATIDGVVLVNGAGSTTDSTPTLGGTGEAGAEIKVYITGNTLLAATAANTTPAGIEVCSTTVAANGSWSCTLANGLPVGNYSFSVVQTRDGQVSSSSSFALQIVSAGGQLPKTGGDPRTAAWFGAGLLGLGATLTGAARRRRRTTN
jgi:Calx-beta domain